MAVAYGHHLLMDRLTSGTSMTPRNITLPRSVKLARGARDGRTLSVRRGAKEQQLDTPPPSTAVLLSPGFSGSATLHRRWRMRHNLLPPLERQMFVPRLRSYLVRVVNELLETAQERGFSATDAAKVQEWMALGLSPWDDDIPADPNVAALAHYLLNEDAGLQRAVRALDSTWSVTSAVPFHLREHALELLSNPDARATDELILGFRVLTTGVARSVGQVEGQARTLILAGSQRSERRKWVHILDDSVGVVVFHFRLCSYNEVYVRARTRCVRVCTCVCVCVWALGGERGCLSASCVTHPPPCCAQVVRKLGNQCLGGGVRGLQDPRQQPCVCPSPHEVHHRVQFPGPTAASTASGWVPTAARVCQGNTQCLPRF